MAFDPWALLTKPIVDRPGTPAGVHVGACAPGRKPACKMPAEMVTQVDTAQSNPWGLARRQVQVLELSLQGMNPTAIACELGVSKSAVSKYICGIKERMDVVMIAQAVLKWHRYYRVLQGDEPELDDILIANLEKATAALRAAKKEAA